MEQQPSSLPQRRQFLYVILAATGTLFTALAVWPVWRYLLPGSKSGAEAKVPVARREIPPGKAFLFDFRGQPAVLLQPEPGRFIALSAVCTHLGCIVQWLPEQGEFLCPCHAGRFSAEGQVLGGPPPRPLAPLPVTVEDDQVLVG